MSERVKCSTLSPKNVFRCPPFFSASGRSSAAQGSKRRAQEDGRLTKEQEGADEGERAGYMPCYARCLCWGEFSKKVFLSLSSGLVCAALAASDAAAASRLSSLG